MLPVVPVIDPRIASIAPGFRAISITVQAAPVIDPHIASQALNAACEAASAGLPAWGEAHLAAWAEVFTRFGAKPQRTPCSAAALIKRVLRDGNLPGIDPVVDLYNAVSIKYAVPVGGENLAAYAGLPHLTVADGTELFDTFKDGEPIHESPAAGEVIWRDETGVTCRRWNWRQGIRTRLDASAPCMWFVLESLPPMPVEALQAAADELSAGLVQLMPGATLTQLLVEA